MKNGKVLSDEDLRKAARSSQLLTGADIDRIRKIIAAALKAFGWKYSEREDALQDIFAYKVLPNYHTWNSKRGSITTWLYKITRHYTIDVVRAGNSSKRKGAKDDLCEYEQKLVAPEKNGLGIDTSLFHEALNKAFDGMPDMYIRVIKLRFLEDRSYEEIQELCDIPLGTVKTHLFRAKRILAERMAGSGFKPEERKPAHGIAA